MKELVDPACGIALAVDRPTEALLCHSDQSLDRWVPIDSLPEEWQRQARIALAQVGATQ